MDEGAQSRNSLYVLLGVWLAISAFAITIFAVYATYQQSAETMVASFAAAAVYTLAVIGYLLLRQWRALEVELRAAEVRAVVADEEGRAKLTFLGAMSHELRTPLNAIIGFSQVIEQEIFGPLGSPQYAEYVRHIRESGAYLLTTLNDVLDMAKLEGGTVKLPSETVNAREEVQTVLSSLEAEAAAKTISMRLVPGNAALADCDPKSLKRVLQNIVRNAIKFTDAGGTVDVTVTRNGERVRIAVKDSGIGIPPDMLGTVGKPFVQVEGNLARKNSGVGLGLAIASALMKLMQGELFINSAAGQGTTVTISLPAERPKRAAPAADQPAEKLSTRTLPVAALQPTSA
jgi:two-component system cell cycle sensor histidine kinase PleC